MCEMVPAGAARPNLGVRWSLQVQQGLIWVWAESGGDAFLESTQRGPVVNPLKQATPPEQFTSSYINYVRDLPGTSQLIHKRGNLTIWFHR